MKIININRDTLQDVFHLCELEGWESYCEDIERTWRALTAPGIVTMVAVDGGKTMGFASLMTDGEIHAYLVLVAVAKTYRGQGIGTHLVNKVFSRSGAKRVDLLSTEDADDFYHSFAYMTFPGFRIYPQFSQICSD